MVKEKPQDPPKPKAKETREERRIQPQMHGESWKKFATRVNKEAREVILKNAQKNKSVSQKRKRWLTQQKERKKNKKTPHEKKVEEEEEYGYGPQRDRVFFGETAERPPLLKLPKRHVKRMEEHKGAEFKRAVAAGEGRGGEKAKSPNIGDPAGKPVPKRVHESLRLSAILGYRRQKLVDRGEDPDKAIAGPGGYL